MNFNLLLLFITRFMLTENTNDQDIIWSVHFDIKWRYLVENRLDEIWWCTWMKL